MCQPDAHWLVHGTKDYNYSFHSTNVNYSKNNHNVCKLLKWATGNGQRATGNGQRATGNGRQATGGKHREQENKTGNKPLTTPCPISKLISNSLSFLPIFLFLEFFGNSHRTMSKADTIFKPRRDINSIFALNRRFRAKLFFRTLLLYSY